MSSAQTDEELVATVLSVAQTERDTWLEANCPNDPRRVRRLQAKWRLRAALSSHTVPDVEPAAKDPLVGQSLGVYRIVEQLPRQGGMSVVYRGERADGRYDQVVAIKVFDRRGHSGDALKRFRREGRVLGHLRHPATVTLLDAGVTPDDRPYLVMEWVDGLPLDVFCRLRRLTIDERLRLFQAICATVQHAHQRTIIHRDLKPSNILVTEDGQPKVLDFGLAKILDPSEFDGLVSQPGQHVGTLLYASPEQLDDSAEVTTRTDVYSLGIILYELIAGSRPFDANGNSSREMRRQLMQSYPDLPSMRLRATGAPPLPALEARDLDAVIMKAIRKDPDERYRSPIALSDDIDRFLRGMPIDARDPSLVYRLRKLAHRHRMAVIAGGALLSGGALIGAVLALRATRRRRRSGAQASG